MNPNLIEIATIFLNRRWDGVVESMFERNELDGEMIEQLVAEWMCGV